MYLFSLSLVFVFIFTSSADDNGESKPNTLQYSTEEFLTAVPSLGLTNKNHFVMFYAPWCGHCSRLAPTWEELATLLNKEDSEVVIAKVDCTEETALCSDHDVTGYPTLKFFKSGEKSGGEKYRGARDLGALSDFIANQLGVVKEVEIKEEVKIPQPINGLYELTEDSFHKHIETGNHIVKFYAPWCGHCQKLSPIWDSLAKSVEYSTGVTVSKVDCTVHRVLCNEFEIKGYPTILWFEYGKMKEKYKGPRTHKDMKAFLSKMVGPAIDVLSVQKKTTEEVGPILTLSGANFEHGIAQGISFIKFYAPWCGHCKRLAPTWEELAAKFANNPLVKIVKIDCTLDSSKELCNKQDVDGFPTLFLYRDGEKVAEYNGSRSLDDLYQFLMKHVPRDEL